jgi:predicted RNA binding protein YcfA (HicA-like mRNA interferase family)
MDSRHESTQFINKLKKAGLLVMRKSRGHYKITHPDQPGVVFLSCTPSDPRSWKNARSQVNQVFNVRIR